MPCMSDNMAHVPGSNDDDDDDDGGDCHIAMFDNNECAIN